MDVLPVTLQGHGILIEPLTEDHSKGLFAIGQEAQDWLYMPRPCFSSLQDCQQWIMQAQELAQQGSHISFAIRRVSDGQLLGSSRYLNIRSRDKSLEIGYTWMGKAAQRTFANTATKFLLLSHAFESLGAIRVELKTDGRNQRSQAAIARIGAKKEGVFRKHMIVQGGYVRDSVYFSIIDDEWPTVKADLLAMLAV